MKETNNPSLKLMDEDVVSTGQRPFQRVGKFQQYEDGDFETQFRPMERTRKRKETEEVKSSATTRTAK